MTPQVVFVLLFFTLVGISMPSSQVFAQKNESPHQFRDLPIEERPLIREPFRQERGQNPDSFKDRREENRLRAVERVRQSDTNRDGAISREEAERSMPHLSRHFNEADANRDGVVTLEEVRIFRERRMQRRLERGRGDPH
jgi:hypothetical protein